MNKDETLALFAQGREAWNAWANEMLARRAELEAKGQWAIQIKYSSERPENEATANWCLAATVDFSAHAFTKLSEFTEFIFPYDVNFQNASFENLANFDDTTFNGTVQFDKATFSGVAWFSKTIFRRNASFSKTIFNEDAWFSHAEFSGDAQFSGATFKKDAWFLPTTFRECGWFSQARFRGSTQFILVYFERAVSFSAAYGESSFSLDRARFDEVPDFIQAHFSEAPRLDNVVIPELPFRWNPFVRSKSDEANGARYRALKRLAIQAHDHKLELDFFASELKAYRGNVLAFFRFLYACFSNFGRSMLRPLLWLLVSGSAFAWAYLGEHFARAADTGRVYAVSSGAWLCNNLTAPFANVARWLGVDLPPASPSLSCLAGQETDPLSAAIGLSIRKALPFAGVASAEKLNQIYACLYGTTSINSRTAPVIPDVVDYLGIAQLLLSLVLIFLFLLAVRNHFRIR